jgi:drug/metabolite transporter (DMT)-like permease
MVVAASAMFAVNGTVSKLVLRAGIEPQQLTTLRATGAFAGLLVLSLTVRLASTRPVRLAVTRRELPVLIAYGVTGFFLVPLLYFVAISRLPVGIALLFEYTAPLLVALWARFGQRQPVRPRLWGGLVLSLAGLACVAQVWGRLQLNGIGVLAGLTAAILLAGWYIAGALSVQRRKPLSLNTWAFGFAALAGLLTRTASASWADSDRLHRLAGLGDWSPLAGTSHGVPVWLLCCYVVVLGSIAPFFLIVAALRHLPATSVGILGMVEPVLAATVAWFTLGEALNFAQLLGGGLVLLGVGLAETARIATASPTQPPDGQPQADPGGPRLALSTQR